MQRLQQNIHSHIAYWYVGKLNHCILPGNIMHIIYNVHTNIIKRGHGVLAPKVIKYPWTFDKAKLALDIPKKLIGWTFPKIGSLGH